MNIVALTRSFKMDLLLSRHNQDSSRSCGIRLLAAQLAHWGYNHIGHVYYPLRRLSLTQLTDLANLSYNRANLGYNRASLGYNRANLGYNRANIG